MKRTLVAVALVAAAIPLAATSGAADTVGCGQVVIQSVTLSADMGPCPNDGIVVGADNVTVNLNGHVVSGVLRSGRYGVWSKNHTGVVVTNGQVTGFDVGVTIEGGAGNTVQQIHAHDNIGRFERSNFGGGILILESADNLVQDNRAIHNGPLGGIEVAGVALRNTIQRNEASYNNVLAPLDRSEDKGINVQGLTSAKVPAFTTIQYNRVVGNGESGIFIGGHVNDNRVIGNVAQGNGHVWRNEEQPGSGIEIGPRALRNLVQGNVVYESGGSGILVRPTVGNPPPAIGNRIIGNTFLTSDLFFGTSTWPADDISEGNRLCGDDVWMNNRFETSAFVGSDCIH